MPRSILMLYSTVDGHTRAICERMRASLEQQSHRVRVQPLEESAGLDLESFDTIVVGASIRYGRHRPEVARFMNGNAPVLAHRRAALFSVNVVARKPHKSSPETNPYMRKLLAELSWRPPLLEVFAGKLDYPRYGFWDRSIIRFIMWLTRGPTDVHGVFEFTDWQRVDAFARAVAG